MLLLLACIENVPTALVDVRFEHDSGVPCPTQVPDCDEDDIQVVDTGSLEVCEPDVAEPRSVPADPDCSWLPELVDPFAMAVEWQLAVGGAGVGVMPVVGDFTDSAVPDVVFTTWVEDRLVVARGDSGEVLFQRFGMRGHAGVAMADINDDGANEVVAISVAGEVVVFTGDGSELWRSQALPIADYAQPVVGDTDGDGLLEVIADRAVLRGTDGQLLFLAPEPHAESRAPVVVDLDLDGADEVLLGELVLSGGQVAFAAPTLTAIVFGVPLQVDKDPEMELAFASQDEVLFLDHDGALLGRSELPGSHPGPPCVGDFDGDGDPELVVPAVNRISMFEGDGTLVWSALAQDTSGLAGCSGFDFDRDGADEVVYADHEDLIILSGDGSVLSRWQGHHSFTIFETPVVADVDGDGAAEVCIGSNNGDFNGLSCLGHVDDAWPGTGSSWGRHDYAESGRVRTRAIVEDPSAPDLTGKLVDLCVDCSGDVELSVQAWNRGALALDGMTWGLYAMDLGSETLLDEGAFASGPVGEADASRVISFPAADLGQMGAVLVLDHEGVESECFEDNNRIEVLLSCP